MEPLITIETIPMKIEYVEREPLRLSSVQSDTLKISKDDGKQIIQGNPMRISIRDSFEPSSVYNWENPTYTATAKYGDDGKLKLNVNMEDGESKPISFKDTTRGIDQMIDLFGASEYSASLEISFDIGRQPGGMSMEKNQNFQFVPPDIELKITQRPKVIIKYVGGPIYAPASADPNYVRPEGLMEMPDPAQGDKLDLKI
ncbi:hypothetical protein [Acetobacterium sp.]|uniref:hypothetical protein n=1 Tax=Acetobacterium sp. TaxID=1872094 RepID=UPI002F407AED